MTAPRRISPEGAHHWFCALRVPAAVLERAFRREGLAGRKFFVFGVGRLMLAWEGKKPHG
jgi:hypothetical protein